MRVAKCVLSEGGGLVVAARRAMARVGLRWGLVGSEGGGGVARTVGWRDQTDLQLITPFSPISQ